MVTKIEIQIGRYFYDGTGWVEDLPLRQIACTLTDLTDERKCGREIAKAVRGAGYNGRPDTPFRGLRVLQPTMLRGSTVGLYYRCPEMVATLF